MKLRRGLLPLLALSAMLIAVASCQLTVVRGSSSPQKHSSAIQSLGIPVLSVLSTEVSPLYGPTLLSEVEFYADAETRNGDYVKVTNAGGFVFVKGRSFKVVPWNTVYDPKTGAWVVFLANVTSDSFRIMYLYLKNGTGAFSLWCYEYDSSLFEGYLFYGSDFVRNKTCSAPSVRMPKLSIVPQTKNPSGMSALGPTLFISSQTGLYMNGTETLSLYPLLYRTFPGTSELWVLIDDHQGRYYYSIFYLFESDREHVFRGHTLRLNDLYLSSFESIAAEWMPGLFPYFLTVVSEGSNITTKIHGFPFKTDRLGRIEVRVPGGDIQVEAQKEASTGSGVRRIFSEWKWLTKSNPVSVRVLQNIDLYAIYKTQLYVSIRSAFGSPVGEGWYDEGATAKFSVEPVIDVLNSTRLVFNGWTGDENISNREGSTTVDRPKTLRANWKRQYEIEISTKGVPQGVSMNLTMNGNQTTASAPFTHRQWADADSVLEIGIDPSRFTSSNTRYAFLRWQTESGTAVSIPFTVKVPIHIIASYKTDEPFAGKATLQIDPTILLLRETVTIKGTTNPARPSTNVSLLWSQDSVEWSLITTVAADSQGNYEHVWNIQPFDKLYVKAKWTYDPDYEPLESSIVVLTRINSSYRRMLQSPEFLRNFVVLLENSPVLSKLAAISLNLLTNPRDAIQSTVTDSLAIPIYLGLFLLIAVLIWRRKHKPSSSS